MKRTKRKFHAVLPAVALCACCAGGAWAAEGDYVLKGGKVYRTDGGTRTLVADAAPERDRTARGLYTWIAVDPGRSDGMRGSEGGIHFFLGEDEKPVGFLPLENAGACNLEFSSSGEKFLLSCGEGLKQDLRLYLVDAANGRFVKKSSFTAASHACWVDPHRFVFTLIDVDKGRRSEAEDDWWRSAAIYDSAVEELTVIRAAAATRNYTVIGCGDEDAGTLNIEEGSVKDEKDWSDDDKIETKELTVPLPAAG